MSSCARGGTVVRSRVLGNGKSMLRSDSGSGRAAGSLANCEIFEVGLVWVCWPCSDMVDGIVNEWLSNDVGRP